MLRIFMLSLSWYRDERLGLRCVGLITGMMLFVCPCLFSLPVALNSLPNHPMAY